MNHYDYNVKAFWLGRPQNPDELAGPFLRSCDVLADLWQTPKGWKLADHSQEKFIPLDEAAREQTAAYIERNISHHEDGDPDFTTGYVFGCMNRGVTTDRRVMLDVWAGGTVMNWAHLQIGGGKSSADLTLATHARYRALVLALASIWKPTWVNAYAFKVGYDKAPTAPGIPAHPYSAFHIPWISYLPAERAQGVVPPAGVTADYAPDGGLVMSVTPDRLDPADPDHMRRSRALAESMIAHAEWKVPGLSY